MLTDVSRGNLYLFPLRPFRAVRRATRSQVAHGALIALAIGSGAVLDRFRVSVSLVVDDLLGDVDAYFVAGFCGDRDHGEEDSRD